MKRSFLLFLLVFSIVGNAQPPSGYYNSTTGLTCASLKTALKTIITTGHTNQGYSALWTQYQVSDVKLREVPPPAGVSNSTYVIWDIYSDNPLGTDPYNFTPGEVASGGQQDNGLSGTSEGQRYNREHSVPLSWHSGSTSSFSGSDYHHVFPTDKYVNGVRANYPYGQVATASFTSLNGSKLGSSAVAGITGTVFEPRNEFKGDVARAFLYFVTRYEDDMPVWGNNADAAQAFDPNTFPSVDIPYLRMMIQWHILDPVSQKEIDRNNAGYTFQGNRNPYVDHPEYVGQVWSASCPGLGALPVEITFFTGKLTDNTVELRWDVSTEINVDRYEVERSFNGTTFSKIGAVTAENKPAYSYTDNIKDVKGRRVYYRLKKVDKDGQHTYSLVFSVHIHLKTMFVVYPNPADYIARIQLNSSRNSMMQVVVTDLSGRIAFDQLVQASDGMLVISTASLPTGNYLVRVVNKEEVYVGKLVVSRQ
jgi:endonuclease I